jgi:hypothetical protein
MARNDGAPAACTSAMIGAISATLAAAIAATASLPRPQAARVSFAFLGYPPSFTSRRTRRLLPRRQRVLVPPVTKSN